MRWLVLALLTFAGLLIQGSLLAGLFPLAAKPDLVLTLAVLAGLVLGDRAGLYAGFVGGFAEDVLASGPLGLNAACKMLVGFAVGSLGKTVFKENAWVPPLVVLAASLVAGFVRMVLGSSFGLPYPVLPGMTLVVKGSVINAMVSPLVLWVLLKAVRPRTGISFRQRAI